MVETRRSLREKKARLSKMRNMIVSSSESESESPAAPRRSARIAKKLADAKKGKTNGRKRRIKKTTKAPTPAKAKARRQNKTKRLKQEKAKADAKFKDSLDLVLICDCTGSMGSWMNRAKETLRDIIKNVLEAHKELKVRIAFVGYRDFCDGANQFAVKDFTENIDEIRNFINSQIPMGGGDMPEDVVGSWIKVEQLNWESETRIAFHICDAPAHGKMYHNDNNTMDTLPKGHPTGETVEEMMGRLKALNIHMTFIKLTKFTDKMIEVMQGAYNDARFTLEVTDMDQSRLAGVSKADVDKAFIDKASFIISKKIGTKKAAKKEPKWTGEILPGNWFSSTNYIKVKNIFPDRVEVSSIAGGSWEMSHDLIKNMDSADHYDYEIPMNRGELVEMLESTRDTIFTISFHKKVQFKDVANVLQSEHGSFFGDKKASRKMSTQILTGKETVIVGKLVKLEPRLGRSTIKDVRISWGHSIRQVDHRTINWIIFKNRKYVLKKSGKKYPDLPKAAYDISNPINTRWTPAKLSVGNWFSDTKYLKVVNFIPNQPVEVVSQTGQKLFISEDIVRQEMYSAQHFAETEKITRTELAMILEEAGNKVFTAQFNAQPNPKTIAEELEKMPADVMDTSRKLNKYVKQLMTGREVNMTGFLAKSEPKMGRSLVINVNAGGSAFRQVDHRGLKSIILKNKNFVLK